MAKTLNDDWKNSNIGLTCAEALGKVAQRLSRVEKKFLELTDLAFESGAKREDIEILAHETEFFVCSWCKENGCYPSDYLKRLHQFERNGWDDELSGKICDSCLKEVEENETKRLVATKEIYKND